MSTNTPGSSPRTRPVERGVTAELLERHDRRGPRYTSYPTAVEFHDGVTGEMYEEHLARADRAGGPVSLYVHLPFCEARCTFCGCHVIATPHRERARPYLGLLERELELLADRLPARRELSQLHFGGGTPTYHTPEELSTLAGRITDLFRPVPGAELAVEVDPRVTKREHLAALAEKGFNRLSVGVQDLTPQVQEAIGRVQTRGETATVIADGRELGFGGVNMDLIYGLPHQTVESFEETVRSAIELGPDRFAIYSFAHVPDLRGNQRALDVEALPDRTTKFALFAMAREVLLESGYDSIGMDHFARGDDELALARRAGELRRNFQGYTTIPAQDVLGVGISAIGDVRGGYWQNAKKLSRYREQIEADRFPIERGVVRDADDELRRDVIHELMCNFALDVPAIEKRHGVEFERVFADDLVRLAEYEREGMVERSPGRIEVTPLGELFVRNLAMCFDRYRHGSETTTFSSTV